MVAPTLLLAMPSLTSRARGVRRRGVVRVQLLAGIVATLVAWPAGAQAPAAWSQVRSAHFTVITVAHPADGERVAAGLEAFSRAFRQLVPEARLDPIAPTVVFAFDRFESYEPYAPRYDGRALRVAGTFVGSAPANYLLLTLGDGSRAWSVAYHELTHLIVSQTMIRPPTWFNEGIAEFYGTFQVSADGSAAELGHAIPEHVALLRRERWLPLDELFEVSTTSSLYNESDRRTVFYAQSWAMVHYLLTTGPDRPARLFEFLARLADGQGTLSAFRTAFGMAPSTMEEAIRRHVERQEWVPSRYALDTRLGGATAVRAQPLPEAEAMAALAGLLLRLDRAGEALDLSQAAVALAPDSGAAHAMLASTLVERHLDVEAVPSLLRAAALGTRDPVTGYYLGTSALRISETAGERVLPRAEAIAIAGHALEAAVATWPTYAEAWAGLSVARLTSAEDPAGALDAARRARALAPHRRHYLLLEAQSLMQAGRLGDARRLMEEVLEHDPATPLADRAAEILTRIAALEEARSRRQ